MVNLLLILIVIVTTSVSPSTASIVLGVHYIGSQIFTMLVFSVFSIVLGAFQWLFIILSTRWRPILWCISSSAHLHAPPFLKKYWLSWNLKKKSDFHLKTAWLSFHSLGKAFCKMSKIVEICVQVGELFGGTPVMVDVHTTSDS